MLKINDEIKQLLQLIDNPIYCDGAVIFNRLQAWSILSLFNKVNQDLEKLNEQLDTSLNLDAISIDFDSSITSVLPRKMKLDKIARKCDGREDSDENQLFQINLMTDYLPNGKEGYNITPDVLGSFRTAMNQLCDEDRISSRTIDSALTQALIKMSELLDNIHKKVENPEPYLFNKLWDDVLEKHGLYSYLECKKEFNDWKKRIGELSLDDLKAKQKQEILELLKTKFFRFCQPPTRGAVKNRTLRIDEDDLEVGTELPEDFDVECTRFEKFIEWKEDCILTLNYEKLGQYIYNNNREFEEDELCNITHFDIMMDYIHEEMAQIKPNFAKYLKRYQEDEDGELLNDLKKIFEPFKEYLKDGIRQTIIDEYLEKLLFDSEFKEEAKKKLRSASKKKYCSTIVLALSFCHIFKPEYNNSNDDLASALRKGLDWKNKTTLYDYLRNAENSNQALNSWSSHLMDELKAVQISEPEAG